MNIARLPITLVLMAGLTTGRSFAQSLAPAEPDHGAAHMHFMHEAGPAVTFAEMRDTVSLLEEARRATEKFRDVRVAVAEGYEAIGPDVPGMGIHYIQRKGGRDSFDLEHPPILLYEKDASVPGGYALVGVSYLFRAPAAEDDQPRNPPFAKSLAKWHRHENICVLPDNSTPSGLSEEQCRAKGGHFTAETQWMVHAWIWKDSPAGVFSPTNPAVQ
jgi:hypothetical protein